MTSTTGSKTATWPPVPGEAGETEKRVPVATLGVRRVYFEEHGAGDPVLLINGLGADHAAWALQTEFLAQRFRVVVFDNPGIGQTTGPPGPYTTELFGDVAAELVRHLEIDRIHVVGASMGGLIAQQVAVRHPSLVRSLVLHCSWWRADPYTQALIRSWQTFARAAGMLELSRQIWLWVFTRAFFEARGSFFAELERQILETPTQTVEAFCDQAEACVTHEPLEGIRGLGVPTLLTVGDHDILTPPDHTAAIHDRIDGSVLHVWPEMGHAPFWEIPDEFNEVNRDFLEAH
jgi:pimeloyl-ACP methyl ester carboxylesterase